MHFEIIGEISGVETIAVGMGVRGRTRLRKRYGRGRWRKLKGVSTVRLLDGVVLLPKYTGTKLAVSARESST
jgi:hypothetical protein